MHSRAVDELIERGEEQSRQGDHPAAIAAYTEALRLDPSSAAAYSARGSARLKVKKFDGAVADYTAAIRLSPTTALLYGSRALARYATSDYRGAVEDNTTAIRLGGGQAAEDLARLHFARGMAYEALGEAGPAEADFARAKELDPPGRFDPHKR